MGQYDELKAAIGTLQDALNRVGTRVDVNVRMLEITSLGDSESKYLYEVSATTTKQTRIA